MLLQPKYDDNDDADVVDCRMKWQAAAAVLLVMTVASESFLIPDFSSRRDIAKSKSRIRQYQRAMSKVSILSTIAKPRISSVRDLFHLLGPLLIKSLT